MRDINLSNKDDLTVTPSESLKRETLEVMESCARTIDISMPRTSVRKRLVLVCAIAMCLILAIVTVAAQVLDYFVYVPGMGIVKVSPDDIFTLKERTKVGWFHIEAMSFVPVADGEYEGMWNVTLLVDRCITGSMWDDPEKTAPIYLTGRGGEKYPLKPTVSNSAFTRYEGYADIYGAGDYNLTWDGKTYTVNMRSIENTGWGEYVYPVNEGITVVTFPLTGNSPYLIFDIIFEPQSENMEYWANNCRYIDFQPGDIKVTDENANTYYVQQQLSIRKNTQKIVDENCISSLLSYSRENIISLETYEFMSDFKGLDAPIAKIEMESISLLFFDISDVATYTVTVPALGEIVDGDKMLNGGVFVDDYGIKMGFDKMSTQIDERNNKYSLVFVEDYLSFDFEENVSRIDISLGYKSSDENGGGGSGRGSGKHWTEQILTNADDVVYYTYILGDGDKNTGSVLDVTYGDEVGITISHIDITIDGDWIIDFTQEK